MKLTEHFTLAELTASATAAAMRNDNAPTPEHRRNLFILAEGLEVARAIVGGPIVITSGYRNPVVNRAVGGVPTSAHALGLAADFRRPGMSALAVARALDDAARKGRIRFDQLILETSRRIVHIAFDPRLRGQRLTQKGGPGTPCLPGIVV